MKGPAVLQLLDWFIGFGKRIASVGVSVAIAVLVSSASAQEDAAWKTGVAFRKQLNDTTIGFRWGGSATLRSSLDNLSRNQQVAIWLDRRVDPDQLIDLSVRDVSLDMALRTIAVNVGCRVCYVDSVAYIGPESITTKLATLAALKRDEVKKLPTSARVRFQKAVPWRWEEARAPKDLLGTIAQQAKVRVMKAERLPHDLWAAGDLPPLAVADRMSLLFAGFDLTFDIAPDGSAIRPASIPEIVAIERAYTPRGSAATLASKIANDFHEVRVRREGDRLFIIGSFEDHDQITRLLRGETVKRRVGPSAEKRYDLKTTNVARKIVEVIANGAKLKLNVDPAVKDKLEDRVSVEVRQASLRHLLDATLEPVGIRYQLEGKTLTLLPDKE